MGLQLTDSNGSRWALTVAQRLDGVTTYLAVEKGVPPMDVRQVSGFSLEELESKIEALYRVRVWRIDKTHPMGDWIVLADDVRMFALRPTSEQKIALELLVEDANRANNQP